MNDFQPVARYRRLLAVAAALVLALPALVWPARAQDLHAHTPAVPIAPLAECHIGVVAILTLPTPSNGKDYGAFLWSPDGAGTASGSLWVATSAGSYRVLFKNKTVLGSNFDGDVDPVTFRLPKSAELRSAFVDLLDDPQPGPCIVYQSWAPGMSAHLRADLAARFASVKEPPATVPSLVMDRSRDCRSGSEAARTLLEAVPPSSVNGSGEVDVSIHLAPDSSVTGAVVKKSSNPALDPVALTAARQSVFATAIKDCEPVATDVVYTVRFQAKPAPAASP